VTFVEKPKQPYPSSGQGLSPTLPRWFGNQRSHQNKDPWQKQNPGNNSTNRSNFPGQDKIRLRHVSLLSHLHAFIVEKMDI